LALAADGGRRAKGLELELAERVAPRVRRRVLDLRAADPVAALVAGLDERRARRLVGTERIVGLGLGVVGIGGLGGRRLGERRGGGEENQDQAKALHRVPLG